MSKPPYCALLAHADLGGARIERIFIKERLEQAVRFRRVGHGAVRPLQLPEGDLLILLGDAVAAGVFSSAFLTELRDILDAQRMARYA